MDGSRKARLLTSGGYEVNKVVSGMEPCTCLGFHHLLDEKKHI